jgi:hypothetical protein
MKAIETKYLPATNYKDARIKAYAEGGLSITIPYPHEYDTEKAHKVAALCLVTKQGWNKQSWYNGIIGGATKAGYAWVFVPKDSVTNHNAASTIYPPGISIVSVSGL